MEERDTELEFETGPESEAETEETLADFHEQIDPASNTYSSAELQEMARDLGIADRAKMNNDELIEAINRASSEA